MKRFKHLFFALAMVASASSAWAVDYQLWVNGTQITDANCADIPSAVSGVTGTVTYDATLNKLTLNNAKIEASGAYAIRDSIPNMTIEVVGYNTINGAKNWSGIRLDKSATITGGGTLHVATAGEGIGIFIYNDPSLALTSNMELTVTGGTRLYAEGMSGISGYGGSTAIAQTYGAVLTVDNAEVTAAFHGNTAVINGTSRFGGALEYLHALNTNGVSIISPSNTAFTPKTASNVTDATTSDVLPTIYIGTPPQDSYYHFDRAYVAGEKVAPYVGDGNDLILDKPTVSVSPMSFMQQDYSYAVQCNLSGNSSVRVNLHCSEANPAHVYCIVRNGREYTNSSTSQAIRWILKLKGGPTDDSRYYARHYETGSTANGAEILEFVVSAPGEYVLFNNFSSSTPSLLLAEMRVIYENNATWHTMCNMPLVELDASKTLASNPSECMFFKLMGALYFDNNGYVTMMANESYDGHTRNAFFFTAYADGYVEVEYTKTAATSGKLVLYTHDLSATSDEISSLESRSCATGENVVLRFNQKLTKHGKYAIEAIGSGDYYYSAIRITKLRFIPDHYTVTLDPNGGTVDPTELVYIKGGDPIASFPEPTRDGFIFDGWDGDSYTFPFTPTADITATAGWAVQRTMRSEGQTDYVETYATDETRELVVDGSLGWDPGQYVFDYWTADQDVQVGTDVIPAGTHLAHGTVVLILRNTTFTAHWANPHGECGASGDNLLWEYDLTSHALTITGSGEMYDYAYYTDVPWYSSYGSLITTVVIGNGATSIGENAFYGCSALTSVTIPSSVTSIGDGAFIACFVLNSVTIADNSELTNIGLWAFESCGLTSFTIPSSVTNIGQGAFQNCTGLTSITIPSNVETLGQSAFTGCSNLASVTFDGTKLTTIPSNAFSQTGLTSVTIPAGVTSIGNSAFQGCNQLASVTIPSGVETIGSGAFGNCYVLTAINIPSGVTSIESSAFYGCSSLESITLPSTLLNIGNMAFGNCSALESITIPNSVTNIGSKVFASSNNLGDIYVSWSDPNLVTTDADIFKFLSNLANRNLHLPFEAWGNYNAAPWNGFKQVPVVTAKEDPNEPGVYYNTFYHGTKAYKLPAGVEAYKAKRNGSDLELTKVAEGGDVLPDDAAVILKSSVASYELEPAAAGTVTVEDNNLQGVDAATPVATAVTSGTCYVLSGHSSDNTINEVGFYTFSGTLGAHKAYLVIPGASPAPKHLRFVFGTTTDIEEVESGETRVESQKILRDGQLIILRNGVEYNVNGQIIK